MKERSSDRWHRPVSNWLLAGVSCKGGQHFVALDSLRGISALLVVLYHMPNGSHLTSTSFARGGFMFVDFFFVLSGFVISYTYASRLTDVADLKAFMIKRFFRLMPLYFFVLLLYVALEFATMREGGAIGDTSGRTVTGLVRSVTLTNSFGDPELSAWNTAGWSISAEWWTYLIFALLLLAPVIPRRLAMLLMAAVGAGICIAFKPTIRITADFGLLRCFFGFGLGALLAMDWERVSDFLNRFGFRFLSFVELMLTVMTIAVVSLTYQGAFSFVAPVLFLACVTIFAKEGGAISRLLKARIFVRAGMLSFSIYMVHQFVIGRQRNVIDFIEGRYPRLIELDNPWHADLVVITAIVAIWVTAELTYRFVELTGQRLGKRVLTKAA